MHSKRRYLTFWCHRVLWGKGKKDNLKELFSLETKRTESEKEAASLSKRQERKRGGHRADSVLSFCEKKRLNSVSSTQSTHAWNAWLSWLEQTASRRRNNGEGVLQKRTRHGTLCSFFSWAQRQTSPVRNMSKYKVLSLHTQVKEKKVFCVQNSSVPDSQGLERSPWIYSRLLLHLFPSCKNMALLLEH